MNASFPSTMLRSDQRAVKDAASDEPVLITNVDNRNLVLCGMERFRRAIAERREKRAYEDRMCEAIERAQAGIARGEFITGSAEEVIAEMERRRLANG